MFDDEKTVDKAALSILFSVDLWDDADPVLKEKINTFFDTLTFDIEQPLIGRIPFLELMEALDYKNRWVYKGSTTFPPCEQFVYWNILEKVYPISPAIIDRFNRKLIQMYTYPDFGGNYRKVQTGFNSDIAFISSRAKQIVMAGATMIALGVYTLF